MFMQTLEGVRLLAGDQAGVVHFCLRETKRVWCTSACGRPSGCGVLLLARDQASHVVYVFSNRHFSMPRLASNVA
jgi:hypothetical protein